MWINGWKSGTCLAILLCCPLHAITALAAKSSQRRKKSTGRAQSLSLQAVPNLMSNHFREVLRLLGITAFESHEQPSQSTNTREWLERNPDMLTESRDELMRLKPSLKLTEVGRRIWPTVDEVIADASQDSALLIWACQALTIMKNGAMKAKMGQSMRTPAG